jgi:transposase
MKAKLPSPSSRTQSVVPEQPKRATFTKAFKLLAIERMRQGEKSPTELALELGVRRNQLYKWAKALDERGQDGSFNGAGRLPKEQESEVVQLRRELARAKEELAILKKFDAYLTRLKR